MLPYWSTILKVFDSYQGLSFSSLNPIYSRKDLDEINTMELNNFSSLVGITGEVLRSGVPHYNLNPRSELSYVREYDNISPVRLV